MSTQETIHTVTLRNGGEYQGPLVVVTMMQLRSLMEENAIAFLELVSLCRDSSHKLFGSTEDLLRKRCLIMDLRDGEAPRVHDAIRKITLAATEGELMDLRMVDPLAPRLTPVINRATLRA